MVKEVRESTRSSSRLQKLGITKSEPVEKKAKKVSTKKIASKEKEDVEEEKEDVEEEKEDVEEEKDDVEEKQSTGGKWKIGGQINEIKLHDQDSQEVNLSEVAKTSGFVVFFYPAANTPGCTNQALCYKDEHEKFSKAGYKVFGCSKGICITVLCII